MTFGEGSEGLERMGWGWEEGGSKAELARGGKTSLWETVRRVFTVRRRLAQVPKGTYTTPRRNYE